jgi:glutamine kinase
LSTINDPGSSAKFTFGTKAETLAKLHGRLSRSTVFEPLFFTVERWREDATAVLESIVGNFKAGRLVVRSSALDEDLSQTSLAGAYDSVLDVDGSDPAAIESAIVDVISQYDENPLHQILVQRMMDDVGLSGVLMTRDLSHGGPYIVINYDDESGKTDTVTAGTSINKTVSIFRDADSSHIRSVRMRSLVEMANELETFCGGVPLDIEFGLTNSDQVVVFQVRQIATSEKWRSDLDSEVCRRLPAVVDFIDRRSGIRPGLVGSRTILGIMPDWNPAELLGAVPGQLSVSIFRELITRSTWRDARRLMGYRAMPPEELMVVVEGQPYIDVRCSFNSFLPDGLDDGIGEKLVDAWMSRLNDHPEFHDKVEFEIAHTILDFDFLDQFLGRYDGLLSAGEFDTYSEMLRGLTIQAIDTTEAGSLSQAEQKIIELASLQKRRPIDQVGVGNGVSALGEAALLLDECQALGTTPFSVMARHAFIAESLLQSSVRLGIFTSIRLDAFKRTVHTILRDMTVALDDALTGESENAEFLSSYGHLRPGTFDIRSLRYIDRADLFADTPQSTRTADYEDFVLSDNESAKLNDSLLSIGLTDISPQDFLDYAKRSISGREYAKFIFTRNLSDALEWLALWGEQRGLSRDQMANIDLSVILDTLVNPYGGDETTFFTDLAEQEDREKEVRRLIKLNALISDPSDVYVVAMLRNEPNFVTADRTSGEVVKIEATSGSEVQLLDKIVCIESADPGFDWIFNKGITGLVTKYGGANSHMAIRCAEIGLPAAIGCGEQVFDRIVIAGTVELDCGEKILRPIHDRRISTSS